MSLLRELPVGVDSEAVIGQRRRLPWPAVREVLLVAALFLAYKLGRLVADGNVAAAMENARVVWNLERVLHLPSEYVVQHAVLGNRALVRAANIYYAYVHFPVTGAYLIWMYLRRPTFYRWARRTMACLTAAALALHLLTPLAPPRMLTAVGMVDTGRLYGPAVYGPPDVDQLANQYAAMPSLHVGWALAVALTLIVATRGRWRWLWLLHPLVTLLVVVVTGNHYWLDAIVVTMLLAAVLLLLPPAPRATETPAPAKPAPETAHTEPVTAEKAEATPKAAPLIPAQR
ncbi:phosphatase PAP2 family protein [Rhizomonospora bruguierae]|uniref:phosphatase PAP2 family protein n=1 Tax=Rhizomonospora bruguierae TaxID=1581705 RepID=UPI001BD1A8EC|nr:phosphatase PAP2 family protein [Micromonospora sp. NBRC 107566]